MHIVHKYPYQICFLYCLFFILQTHRLLNVTGEDTLPFVSLLFKLQQIMAFVPFSFCYYLISTRHNTHNHHPHSTIQGIINKYSGKKEKRITKGENAIKRKENNIISSTYFPIFRIAVGSYH